LRIAVQQVMLRKSKQFSKFGKSCNYFWFESLSWDSSVPYLDKKHCDAEVRRSVILYLLKARKYHNHKHVSGPSPFVSYNGFWGFTWHVRMIDCIHNEYNQYVCLKIAAYATSITANAYMYDSIAIIRSIE
jgi:hypothetical protein